MARRRGLVTVVLVALVALVAPVATSTPAPAATPTRPDIVVVMLDDMTVAQFAHLPTIAGLSRQGTTFLNAYAATPECCPSRATFLTGQYLHNHRVLSGLAPTGGYGKLDHTNALPVWLRASGYHTAHVGKYMNGIGLSDPLQRPAGWDRYAGLVDPSTYDYWGYTINHDGVLETRGTAPEDYQTDVLADMAVEDIESAPADAPLFLQFAPLAPHAGTVAGSGARYPVPPPRHRRTFTGSRPTTPDVNEADVSDKPAAVRALAPLTATNLANLQSWWQQSIEALRAADDAVARIVGALRDTGRLDRTVIIVTSDNGFLHGEHRIALAKIWPYEPSVRIPLVIAGPRFDGGRRLTGLASMVDLAPTIVALAGASAHVRRTMDGLDLSPMVTSPGHGSGRTLLIELGPSLGRRHYRALRGPRWKYIEHSTGERELYDLVVDPHELVNRAEDPALASVRATLAGRLGRLVTCAGPACTTIV